MLYHSLAHATLYIPGSMTGITASGLSPGQPLHILRLSCSSSFLTLLAGLESIDEFIGAGLKTAGSMAARRPH